MSWTGLTPYNQRGNPLTQRSIAFGSIGATYTIVGSIFSTPVLLLMLVSTLDAAVQISYDGIDDHFPLVSNGLLVLDEKTNGIVLPGTYGIYVKTLGSPSAGSLYVCGFTI